MRTIAVAPYMPLGLLKKSKSLEENDNYNFIDGITYNTLYFDSKKSLAKEIKEEVLLPANELFIKLIYLSEAEKNFRARKLEKIKLENIFNIDNIFQIPWCKTEHKIITYGDVFYQNEVEMSAYHFEHAHNQMQLWSLARSDHYMHKETMEWSNEISGMMR